MTEEEEATYKYAYDKKDRVISQTNPLGASNTFKYDGNDNVTESVDENGTVTTYTYDKLHNMKSSTMHWMEQPAFLMISMAIW